MSTTYYGFGEDMAVLTEPPGSTRFDRLVIGREGATVWLNGDPEDIAFVLLRIARGIDERVARCSGGRVEVTGTGPDAEVVISEYGELTTLGELRAEARRR